MKIMLIILLVIALAALLAAVAARGWYPGSGERRLTYESSGELAIMDDQRAASEIAKLSDIASGTRLPDDVRRAFVQAHRSVVSAEEEIGSIDWTRAQMAFETDESLHAVYLVPTTGGWVCYGLGAESTRCVPSLPHGISWTVASRATDDGSFAVSLYGIAADGLSRLSVVLNGRSRSAEISGNAFRLFVQSPRPATVTSLEVIWVDGRRDSIEVSGRP